MEQDDQAGQAARQQPQQPEGFGVEITLLTGLYAAEQLEFERSLQDYLNGQGLQSIWTQCMGSVWKDDMDLTLTDQCDLMCWLAERADVAGAVVSQLRSIDGIEDVEGPQLRISTFTVAATAGRVLYRLGLLRPEEFARVLGGFVQPIYAE